jgi:hypothetical protein
MTSSHDDTSAFTSEEMAQLDADAAEAEVGYDPEHLAARRRPGRAPSIGRGAGVVVPVRLDPDRLRALDALAARGHRTRSQVIRDAIDHELATA